MIKDFIGTKHDCVLIDKDDLNPVLAIMHNEMGKELFKYKFHIETPDF